jgi:hypothetical protein
MRAVCRTELIPICDPPVITLEPASPKKLLANCCQRWQPFHGLFADCRSKITRAENYLYAILSHRRHRYAQFIRQLWCAAEKTVAFCVIINISTLWPRANCRVVPSGDPLRINISISHSLFSNARQSRSLQVIVFWSTPKFTMFAFTIKTVKVQWLHNLCVVCMALIKPHANLFNVRVLENISIKINNHAWAYETVFFFYSLLLKQKTIGSSRELYIQIALWIFWTPWK